MTNYILGIASNSNSLGNYTAIFGVYIYTPIFVIIYTKIWGIYTSIFVIIYPKSCSVQNIPQILFKIYP